MAENVEVTLKGKDESLSKVVNDARDNFIAANKRMAAAAKEPDFDPLSADAKELQAEVNRAGDAYVKAMGRAETATRKTMREQLGLGQESKRVAEIIAAEMAQAAERVDQLGSEYRTALRALQLADAPEEVAALRKEVDRLGKEYIEAGEEAERGLLKIIQTTDATEAEVKQARTAVVALERSFDEVRANQKLVGEGAKKSFGQMTAAIQTARRAVAGLFVGLGAAEIVRGGLRALTTFEERMQAVRGVLGLVGEEGAKSFRQLRDLAALLGEETRYTAAQAAEAMQNLARAGFNTNEILAATPGLLSLASAGALDLGRATEIAADLVRGFGLTAAETGRVADVLAKGANSASTTVELLSNALSYVAPVARGMNLSLEETAAAIGVLSDAGIKGERAGTSLRNILSRIVSQDTLDQLKGYGVAVENIIPGQSTLAEILETVAGAGVDVSFAFDTMAQRAGPALLVLAENIPKLRQMTETLKASAGAADELAKVMEDSLLGDLRVLQSRLEGVAIAAGEEGASGALRGLVQGITNSVGPAVLVVSTIVSGLTIALGTLVEGVGRIFQALLQLPLQKLGFDMKGLEEATRQFVKAGNDLQQQGLDRILANQGKEANELEHAIAKARLSVARLIAEYERSPSPELARTITDQIDQILASIQVLPAAQRTANADLIQQLGVLRQSYADVAGEVEETGRETERYGKILEALSLDTGESIRDMVASLIEYADAVRAGGAVTGEQADLIVEKIDEIRESIRLLPADAQKDFGAVLAGLDQQREFFARFSGESATAADKLAASLKGAREEAKALGETEIFGGKDVSETAQRVADLKAELDELRGKELTGFLSVDELNRQLEISGELAAAQQELRSQQAGLAEAAVVFGAKTLDAAEAQRLLLEQTAAARAGMEEHQVGLGLTSEAYDAINQRVRDAEDRFTRFRDEIDNAGISIRDHSGEVRAGVEVYGNLSDSLAAIKQRLDSAGAASSQAGQATASAATAAGDLATKSTDAARGQESLEESSIRLVQSLDGQGKLMTNVAGKYVELEEGGKRSLGIQQDAADRLNASLGRTKTHLTDIEELLLRIAGTAE